MPARKPARKAAKQTSAKRQSPTRRASSRGVVAAVGDVKCADFVGRDKKPTITYGFSATDVERPVYKVLAFLQAGTTFVSVGNALRAELNGETLIFHPSVAQRKALSALARLPVRIPDVGGDARPARRVGEQETWNREIVRHAPEASSSMCGSSTRDWYEIVPSAGINDMLHK